MVLARLLICVLLAAEASGCAAAAAARAPLRAAREEEQRIVGDAIAPLLLAAGLWPRPGGGCGAALAVQPAPAINLAVAPHRECRFALAITEGALRSLSPAELRAALAHEIGHVELGHFAARAGRRAAEREARKEIEDKGTTAGAAATAVPVIGPLIAIGIIAAQGVADTAVEAGHRAYDREEERAADRYALDLLARIGEPGACRGLAALLERLERETGKGPWAGWLGTHPTPGERLRAARERCPG
jgi:Zn-dependent protease with chaperone function